MGVGWALVSASGSHAGPPPLTSLDPDYGFDYRLFGRAVAIDGDRIISSGEFFPEPVDLRWVRVFERDAASWSPETSLLASPGPGGPHGSRADDFGFALAIDGDVAVVGAPEHWVEGDSSTGVVYVYRFPRPQFPIAETLTPPEGTTVERFGHSVDIKGDTIVVGTPRAYTGEEKILTGAAYVFRRSDVGWHRVQTLAPPPSFVEAGFGHAVVIDKNVIAVSALGPTANTASESRGSVFVYRKQGDQWVEEQQLSTTGHTFDPTFGFALALSENTLGIGAPTHAEGYNYRGAVYLYEYDGQQWALKLRLDKPGASLHAVSYDPYFGKSVALSPEALVVGSTRDFIDGEFIHHGSTYLFRFDGLGYSVVDVLLLQPDDLEASDVGFSVAVDGATAVIGAPAGYQRYWPGKTFVQEIPLIGDADRDGRTDLTDAPVLVKCLEGPPPVGIMDGSCLYFDFIRDGDVDLADFAVLQRNFGASE